MSKKLLIASLVLVIGTAVVSYAADSEPTTYTEKFIQKHTKKIVDKEKELQQQQQLAQLMDPYQLHQFHK